MKKIKISKSKKGTFNKRNRTSNKVELFCKGIFITKDPSLPKFYKIF